MATISTDHREKRRRVDQANQTAAAEQAAKVNGYGGGLAYFTLFCLAVFIVAVAIKELHRAGAGIDERVEPGAFDFEAGPVTALLTALRGRFNQIAYGLIHRIEQSTQEAPAPVLAPTVWGRKGDGLRIVLADGVKRETKPLRDAKPAAVAKRTIGFRTATSAPVDAPDANPTDATVTDCVSDQAGAVDNDHTLGTCDHCGTKSIRSGRRGNAFAVPSAVKTTTPNNTAAKNLTPLTKPVRTNGRPLNLRLCLMMKTD